MNARSRHAMPVHKAKSPVHAAAVRLDHAYQLTLARSLPGMAPATPALALADWTLHLATSPATLLRLTGQAQALGLQWLYYQGLCMLPPLEESRSLHPMGRALAEDTRFTDPSWYRHPWIALPSALKALENWWEDACDLHGMSERSRRHMHFHSRQWLDMLSPSNWPATNPEVILTTVQSRGDNLVRGMRNAMDAACLRYGLEPAFASDSSALRPGKGLAMTPGQVVLRNPLIELIQYSPATRDVMKEPVLIVPSCILKYYILDLSPHNSLVAWLVRQGHTVYMISWRNPDEDDALLGFNDYVSEGVLAALDHVHQDTGAAIHLAGYCLGGTFAAIAAATLCRSPSSKSPPALASLTLLAAETDFSEPGELGVLVDEAQVDMLEAMMAAQGFLTGQQMAASFQYLHSRDLVWANRTRTLLLGKPPFTNDLMSWNADVTRLPAVMHSEYLRHMYLRNELAEDRYIFDDQPVSLGNIHVPLFAVGTLKDHVSPWRSVFKIHRLASGDITFALTNGGHNAGIISEPGHPGRHYLLRTTTAAEPSPIAEDWMALAESREGSWWTAWHAWLLEQSSDKRVPARVPREDSSLGPAPGQYVLVKYAD